MKELTFQVFGKPVAKAPARTFQKGGRTISWVPGKSRKWMEDIKMQILQHRQEPLHEGGVIMVAIFDLPMPKRMIKKSGIVWENHTKKPDEDNLMKALKDAMKGIIYKDDSQVFCDMSLKRYNNDFEGLSVACYLFNAEEVIFTNILCRVAGIGLVGFITNIIKRKLLGNEIS